MPPEAMRTLQVASELAAVAAAAMVVVITVARADDENARSRRLAATVLADVAAVLPLGAYDFVSDTRHLPGLPLGLAVLKDLLTLAELSFAFRYWRSLDERDPPRRQAPPSAGATAASGVEGRAHALGGRGGAEERRDAEHLLGGAQQRVVRERRRGARPAGTVGATTSVAIRFPAEPSFSSQVRNSAVRPARYSGLARIFGTNVASHASPTATAQSCVSLRRFGVTKVKRADRSGASAERRVLVAHSAAIEV